MDTNNDAVVDYDYDALVGTTKIEDITSCEYQQEWMRMLKNNDPECTDISLVNILDGPFQYNPTTLQEFGWLGYFIGKNTQLKSLSVSWSEGFGFDGAIELFCRGVNSNRSIEKISFECLECTHFRATFKALTPFFQTNVITKIDIAGCDIDAECCRLITSAIGKRNGNKSLESFSINDTGDEDNPPVDRQIVDIILALSLHPNMKRLELADMNMGRCSCLALETLLQWTTNGLRDLNLGRNEIDDESAIILARGIGHCKDLQKLNLGGNLFGDAGVDALLLALKNSQLVELKLLCSDSITNEGYKSLSSLLEGQNSSLEALHLRGRNVDDETAHIFANALRNNCTLKMLNLLLTPRITAEGSSAFEKLLCDSSSVNNTFHSNHSLEDMSVRGYFSIREPWFTNEMHHLLQLNTRENKKEVAMVKILMHHSDFNIEPLFEWELKLLPYVIDWLERSSDFQTNFDKRIEQRKLSVIYDYVRGMPKLCAVSAIMGELKEIEDAESTVQQQCMMPTESFASQIQDLERRRMRAMKSLRTWNVVLP